jgi:hypothetical protein
MMKSCGKRNDQEEISKDEFIAWWIIQLFLYQNKS